MRFSKCLGMISLFSLINCQILGGFEWEIFPNFGMSEKSEKIEIFISENFRSSWFFLTILTYKIFDFDLKQLKMGKFFENS